MFVAANDVQGSDSHGFGYDEHNRLVSYTDGATTAGYGYDPQGRRIEKTVDGLSTYYLWDGTRLLAELDAGGNVLTQYAYLPGQRVPAEMQDANGVYEVHSDHLQTPKRLTDTSQTLVWSAEHVAYGEAIVDEDPDNNGIPVTLNIRFPGQYYDQETGLHYNFFRYYDLNTGRYITQDPIGQAGGLNLYAYVEGDPVGLMDPLGLLKTGRNKNTGDADNPLACKVGCFADPTTDVITGAASFLLTKGLGSGLGTDALIHMIKSGGKMFDAYNIPVCLDDCDEQFSEPDKKACN